MAALSNTALVDNLPTSTEHTTQHHSSPSKHRPTHQGLHPSDSLAASRSSADRSAETTARRTHHASSSGASIPRSGSTRTPTGILSRAAAAALDRTQNVIDRISDPALRPRQSNPGLARLSLVSNPQSDSEPTSPSRSATSSYNSPAASTKPSPNSSATSSVDRSNHYPEPLRRSENKMHQTSSRLLRMTDDDRPFTRVSANPHLPA